MRRGRFVATMVALLAVVIAVPALADAPTPFETSFMFTDVNPCTGEDTEITINIHAAEHLDHENNFVATVRRDGTAEPGGYTMTGNETFVANKGGARGHFVDLWQGEDGSVFRVLGVFNYNANQEELKVDRFRLQCVRP